MAASCEQGDESSRSAQRTLASGGLFKRVRVGERAFIRGEGTEKNRYILYTTFILVEKIKSVEMPLCKPYDGGSGGILPLTLHLGAGMRGSESRPGRFTPRTHQIAGWVGPRAGLGDLKNKIFAPFRNLNPQPIFN